MLHWPYTTAHRFHHFHHLLTYETPPTQTPFSQAVPGGKFNMAKSKNYIDQAIFERVQFPGPCEYDLPEMTALTSGGRFNSGKSKTEVEVRYFFF